jgi:hypothetical protein
MNNASSCKAIDEKCNVTPRHQFIGDILHSRCAQTSTSMERDNCRTCPFSIGLGQIAANRIARNVRDHLASLARTLLLQATQWLRGANEFYALQRRAYCVARKKVC